MRVLPPRTYASDTAARKRLFTPASVAHPAKMHTELARDLFLRYTLPGQTVLDPFGGIGTSLLGAILPEPRNVWLVELEPKFVALAQANAARLRHGMLPGLPIGEMRIEQGDSRRLPFPTAGCDVIASSPPYADSDVAPSEGNRPEAKIARLLAEGKSREAAVIRQHGSGQYSVFRAEDYGSTPGQIGALSPGDVDAVLGSPPYGNAINQHPSADNLERRLERMRAAGVDTSKPVNVGGPNGGHRIRQRYGGVDGVLGSPPFGEMNARHAGGTVTQRPMPDGNGFDGGREAFVYSEATPGQIGNLPHAVITSPPYAEALTYQRPGAGGEGWELMRAGFTVEQIAEMRRNGDPRVTDTRRAAGYSRDGANIGNLPAGEVDAVISSPPYGDLAERNRSKEPYAQKDPERSARYGQNSSSRNVDGYGSTEGQIGSLVHVGGETWQDEPRHHRRSKNVDERLRTQNVGCPDPTCMGNSIPIGGAEQTSGADQDRPPSMLLPENVTIFAAGGVDTMAMSSLTTSNLGLMADLPPQITSSPCASPATQRPTCENWTVDASCVGETTPPTALPHGTARPTARMSSGGQDSEQPETYAGAMLKVLAECYRVVRPGGVLVLVTGDYVRSGKIIDLAADTIRLAEAAGWTPVERWRHEKAGVSFWRRLHHKQGRPIVTHEDVLVFCKGHQGWAFTELPPTTVKPASLGLLSARGETFRQVGLLDAAEEDDNQEELGR